MAREVAAIERIDRDAAIGHAEQVAGEGAGRRGLIASAAPNTETPGLTAGRCVGTAMKPITFRAAVATMARGSWNSIAACTAQKKPPFREQARRGGPTG